MTKLLLKLPVIGYEFSSFDCTANGEPVNYNDHSVPTRASFWASNNVDVVCTFENTYTAP